MSLIGTSLTLLFALTALNLLLLYGVIRRLRLHGEQLAARPPAPAGSGLRPSVEPFAVTAADGRMVTREALREGALVGFFAADCEPCAELLPRFIEAAPAYGSSGADGVGVLAVVADGGDADGYAARLATVATVVAGPAGGAVAAAFGARGYPTLCEVGAGGAIRELSQHALAARPGVPA